MKAHPLPPKWSSARNRLKVSLREAHSHNCSHANAKRTASIRDAARSCGIDLALQLDRYWEHRPQHPAEASVDVIDLFCGCGGMSAGFEAFNALIPTYRILSAVDIDSDARETYTQNFGLTPEAIDISSLARSKNQLPAFLTAIGRTKSRPLVLIGCSPCQGFSSHRNERAPKDLRNSLFLDFIRVVERSSPDVVVMENVPELLTGPYWDYVQQARERLEACGYYVHISYHNLAGYGLPQERFRALLLAMKIPFAPINPFLARDEYRTVRQAIGGMRPLVSGERDPDDDLHYGVHHKVTTIETIMRVPANGGNLPPGVGPACLQRAHARNGKRAYEDVYGRLHWDKPAITITAHARNPASGRFVHPEQHRGLSVREAALLQGFPKTYWVCGSLDSRVRQIGNAVPPIFAAFLAAHIAGELASGALSSSAFEGGVNSSLGESFSRLIPSLKAGTGRQRLT